MFQERKMSELTDEEHAIVLGALKCLHQLKYIPDIAIMLKANNELMQTMIEEIVKVREQQK